MRRRRLDAYQRAPDWPGKEPAWRWERSRYDQFLLLAASMLDVDVPDHDEVLLAPEVRALVEDGLSQADLVVGAPSGHPGGWLLLTQGGWVALRERAYAGMTTVLRTVHSSIE